MPGEEKQALNSEVRQLWEGSVGAESPGWRDTVGKGRGKAKVCESDKHSR